MGKKPPSRTKQSLCGELIILTLNQVNENSSIAIFTGLFQLSNNEFYFYYFILKIFDYFFRVIINLRTSLTGIDTIAWQIKANPGVKGLPRPGIEHWTPQFSASFHSNELRRPLRWKWWRVVGERNFLASILNLSFDLSNKSQLKFNNIETSFKWLDTDCSSIYQNFFYLSCFVQCLKAEKCLMLMNKNPDLWCDFELYLFHQRNITLSCNINKNCLQTTKNVASFMKEAIKRQHIWEELLYIIDSICIWN